jgi:hypothetical protein
MTQKKLREDFFISAQWFDRREDAHACALRMARMLDELETGHPALAHWYRLHNPGEPCLPLRSAKPGIDELTELFEAGISKRDDGPAGDNSGDRILGTGHMLFCHNHLKIPRVSCNVWAGNWRALDRHDGRSNVVLDFGDREPSNEDFLTVPVLLRAILAIVRAWAPDSAQVGETAFLQHLEERDGRRPYLARSGWISYLSETLFAQITPPPAARIERVPGFGRFLIATDEPFTMANPAHRRAGEAIHDALEPARDALRRRLAVPVTERRD